MIKITVTNEHIAKGNPGTCNQCPVALALRDKYPGDWISVNKMYMAVGNTFYHVPRSVKRFIRNFDYFNKAKPFSFFLRPEKRN